VAREVIRKFFYWPLPLNGSALRTRDARRIGVARAKAIGVTINTRLSRPGPWFASLDLPRDANEKAEIQKAVAEWVRASPSIFDAINRTWLRATYGVEFVTLEELAALV
jgi:hypothetical protein